MVTYACTGFRVSSNVAMEGYDPLPDESGPCDATLSHGELPWDPPPRSGLGLERVGAGLLLRITARATLLVQGGDTVVFRPEGGRGVEWTASFSWLRSLPALLYQRRGAFVHGSALAIGGRSAVILGPAGMGKSTLSLALSRQGHAPLADDTLGLDFRPTGIHVVSWERSFRLWLENVHRLGIPTKPGLTGKPRVRFASRTPLPPTVGAVFMARRPPPGADASDPVSRMLPEEAEPALQSQLVTPKLIGMARLEGYEQAAMERLRAAPLYWLNIPGDFGGYDTILRRVVEVTQGQG